MEVLESFVAYSVSVQAALARALAPSARAVVQAENRVSAEAERAALQRLPQHDGIPTHLIPAPLPQDPDAFVDPGEEEFVDSAEDVRAAQDHAYLESLAADRRARERTEAAEEEAMMEAVLAESRREEEERRAKADAEKVRPEADEGPESCALVVRMVGGERKTRRMWRSDTIGMLRHWVSVERGGNRGFAIVTDYPRRRFDDDDQTLESAGMWPRAAINIVEEDE